MSEIAIAIAISLLLLVSVAALWVGVRQFRRASPPPAPPQIAAPAPPVAAAAIEAPPRATPPPPARQSLEDYPTVDSFARHVELQCFSSGVRSLLGGARFEDGHGGAGVRVILGSTAAVFPFKATIAGFDQERWVLRIPVRPWADGNVLRYTRLMDLSDEDRRRLGIPTLELLGKVFEEGVVGGHVVPGLVMEHVNGVPLDSYLGRHATDRETLLELAVKWRDRLLTFEAFGLAHHDLQHGNVLVDDDRCIRFIDFDDAYLPGLVANFGVGHPNYQHPRMAHSHWGPSGDAFPGLLIWLVLRATAMDPSLFDDFGDEGSMLFRRQDLDRPGETPLWRRLRGSSDERVRAAAATLAALCGEMEPPSVRFRELLPTWTPER